MPLQDRLARYLEKIQHFCGENEVRVIATARNETERERADEPSEWEKLQWDTYPRFWKRFARYPLPRADETAQTNVLQAAITQTGVATDLDDAGLRQVARTNSGSLRNLIENVKNAKVENRPFTAQNFMTTPNQTWQERYRRVIQKFPAARYVYDAVDLLRTTGIDLYDFTVQPTARLMAGGNILQRVQRGWQIRCAARYLINAEHILEPSDGQIEAKENRVDAAPYLPALTQLVLKAADQHPRAMRGSLFGLALTLYNAKRFELAERLMRQAIRLDPNDAAAHNNLGALLAGLGRTAEAEAEYRKAIEIGGLPDGGARAHHNLGNLLAKDATRTADAEAEYRAAIRLNPNLAQAHYNLGNLLAKDAARTTDAETEYREAIRLDPNDAAAHKNIMILLRLNNREDEAIPFIEKWMQLEPDNFDPPLALASVHKKLGHPAESAKFAAQARTLMKPEDWYNLACLESVCGNVDVGIEHLRRAAQVGKLNRKHAKRDPDLEWIRDDPRFKEIVGE
jgi:Flp pilus assembly protein TadD